jgi:cytosine/adenosine deaminase-related metal-dependent hydrolase
MAMNRATLRWFRMGVAAVFAALPLGWAAGVNAGLAPQAVDGGIVIHGTVVTMDHDRSILKNGGVFVRGGQIVATWQGSHVPPDASSAVHVDLGPKTLIFPGLINLHDHPTYDVLNLWPPPSSHRQPLQGRPLGTEPYANRYQWNRMLNLAPPEELRLIDTPQTLLTNNAGLGFGAMVGKYAEVRAMLGGETTTQGDADPVASRTLIRNVEAETFNGSGRIGSRVAPIGTISEAARSALVARMAGGELDAWLVHLAEGVRDGERPLGDPISSRAEFASLRDKGLLTEATVIIHGVALEAEDFTAMRAAASLAANGVGDGAKLVWSPLSNLLLYGRTLRVYQALQAGVLVSLGTDWSPSGSRNLLDELKIADIALRDERVLGADRSLVPELSIAGKTDEDRQAAEAALDRTLVEMATVNPARTLRWLPFVGSVEPGKRADLLVITRPDHPSVEGLPSNPYRALIDASEADVRLVLVNGDPLAGDVAVMQTLKPGDCEVVASAEGCIEKAVDVTDPTVPQGSDSFAFIESQLRNALAAMAGDHPPVDGGPAPLTNTYSYLKARIPGAGALTDAQFTLALAAQFGVTAEGRLNMEGLQLAPLFLADDDFAFHLLGGDGVAGLIADPTPPFKLYPSNFNSIGALGNPYEASAFLDRYYEPCVQTLAQGVTTESEGTSRITAASLTASPNPARSRVELVLDVQKEGAVSIRIHDIAGRLVRTVTDQTRGPGRFRFGWDLANASGARVPAGLYLARVSDGRSTRVTRIAVLR